MKPALLCAVIVLRAVAIVGAIIVMAAAILSVGGWW
jgi:hypothetical protein